MANVADKKGEEGLPKGHLAVGISVEGRYVQMAKVLKSQGQYYLMDARLYELEETLDLPESSSENGEELEGEIDLENLDDIVEESEGSLEIKADDETVADFDLESADNDAEGGAKDDAGKFLEILLASTEGDCKTGISLSEPQVFYNIMETDWGLKGKKLRKRISSELAELKEEYAGLRNDSLSVTRVSEARLMAVIREGPVTLLEKMEEVKSFAGNRLPFISFTESLELSIVNLVRHRYSLADDAVTAIVYVGEESSRFIFMKGRELHYIAPVIADGANSMNIGSTLASRLLLEVDTIDLPSVDTILLAGYSHLMGVEACLRDTLNIDVNIERINVEGFDLSQIPPGLLRDNLDRLTQRQAKDASQSVPDFAFDDYSHEATPEVQLPPDLHEDISPYTAAIGTALRILDREKHEFYEIDVTPARIKEGQNKWVMTLPGWIFLMIIPLVVVFTLFRSTQLKDEVARLRAEIQPKQIEMELFAALNDSIEAATGRLNYLERSFSVVDSIVVGTETWSTFITNLVDVANDVGGFWFTDMTSTADGRTVNLVGYSIYRNRIPRFIDQVGGAKLKRVEVQDIREKRVYRFEVEVKVPKK